jgi:hypothetical protein
MEEIGGELEAHRSLYDGGVYDEQVWQKEVDGVFSAHLERSEYSGARI